MSRNVTLRMDDDILKKCRHAAVEEDMSLSQWITVQLRTIINQRESFDHARQRALKRLERGYPLGGKPLSREQVYERE